MSIKIKLNASLVRPAEVVKSGILSNAARLLVFHTHPSGNLDPSREDMDVTGRLIAAADIIGINLLDHLIIQII